MTLADGNIYALPMINDCYLCSLPVKMWIYQPWLDALGMEAPQTTEKLYLVLKAFKEGDPNGNGLADEIPLVAATSGWYSSIEGYIMNAFIYDDLKKITFTNVKKEN